MSTTCLSGTNQPTTCTQPGMASKGKKAPPNQNMGLMTSVKK